MGELLPFSSLLTSSYHLMHPSCPIYYHQWAGKRTLLQPPHTSCWSCIFFFSEQASILSLIIDIIASTHKQQQFVGELLPFFSLLWLIDPLINNTNLWRNVCLFSSLNLNLCSIASHFFIDCQCCRFKQHNNWLIQLLILSIVRELLPFLLLLVSDRSTYK